MKKYILFFTLCIAFDSVASDKPVTTHSKAKKRGQQSPTKAPSSIKDPHEEIATTNDTSTPTHLAKKLDNPNPTLDNSELEKSLSSNSHQPEKQSLDHGDWVETVPGEVTSAESTPYTDAFRSLCLLLRTANESLFVQQLWLFFKEKKAYEVLLEDLTEIKPQHLKQEMFNQRIKELNALHPTKPRQGFEIISQAIEQAKADGRTTILHELTKLSLQWREQLPRISMIIPRDCLKAQNKSEEEALIEETFEALLKCYENERTISSVDRYTESPLGDLSDEQKKFVHQQLLETARHTIHTAFDATKDPQYLRLKAPKE